MNIREFTPSAKLLWNRDAAVSYTHLDVTKPLVGERGASRIFGPQKGATEAMIVELDRNLADVYKRQGL